MFALAVHSLQGADHIFSRNMSVCTLAPLSLPKELACRYWLFQPFHSFVNHHIA